MAAEAHSPPSSAAPGTSTYTSTPALSMLTAALVNGSKESNDAVAGHGEAEAVAEAGAGTEADTDADADADAGIEGNSVLPTPRSTFACLQC